MKPQRGKVESGHGNVLRHGQFHVGDRQELEGEQEAASAMPEQCTGRSLPGVRWDFSLLGHNEATSGKEVRTEEAGRAKDCPFLNFFLLYI